MTVEQSHFEQFTPTHLKLQRQSFTCSFFYVFKHLKLATKIKLRLPLPFFKQNKQIQTQTISSKDEKGGKTN
jgi:hypothetical protein